MVKGIVLKNQHIRVLDTLLDIKLHGPQSRARVRILRAIQPIGQQINDDRIAKLKELAEKDEKGEPKMIGPTYDLKPDKLKEFQAWFADLVNEECVLDVFPSNEADYRQLRDILNNYPKELDALMAEEMEQILDALDLVFDPKAKKAEVSHETNAKKAKKSKK